MIQKFFISFNYSILKFIYKLRHIWFEMYNKSKLIKDFKFILKKIIPLVLFNYFKRRKIKQLEEFPESFSIETVNICNAKCWFCPQPDHVRKKGYMDFKIFKKIIDEIAEYRKKVKSIALFMDGEPTLHKKLIDFLKYAKEKKITNIYLSSNMEFFSQKIIDQIFENKLQGTLKYIICSLDGVSEVTHQSNRIGVDTKKAYENTKLLINTRNKEKSIYPWIFPRMLINETNKHEEKDFYEYWKNKSDKVLRTSMHNWGGQIEDENLIENTDSFSATCFFPFSQCFIQIDGGIRLCCLDVDGKFIYGDLENKSIKEIWKSENFSTLRKNFLNKNYSDLPKLCQKCTYPSKGQWSLPFFWEKSL